MNGSLAVESSGDAPVRTRVLFLHALGVSGGVWEGVIAQLPDFLTWAPDLPGHGSKSTERNIRTVDEMADGIAKELNGEQVHLIGMSLGGLVAQSLAARYPNLVSKLVLVDTVAVYPIAMKSMWLDRSVSAPLEGMSNIAVATLSLWFTSQYLTANDTTVREVRKALLETDVDGYSMACKVLAEADTRSLVVDITAPTMVICGSDDGEPFTQAAEWFSSKISNSTVEWLPNLRHAGALEKPKEFAQLISSFLKLSD
ncbi:unannotated protein [freshwater metagenome]|uniref:Unannotated protein n=1 Tax=freshwater metagenome TaxID=449393 RepID=A0A6J7PB91_9ZZZZ